MLFPFTRAARRRSLLAEPFPEAWREILRRNVALYRLLAEAEQARLRDALRIFIAEKFWEGCQGQEITDEMKVTIAAQACLLLLGFDDYFFEDVRTILVYRGGFLVDDREEGVNGDGVRHLSGMASAGGPILLSWWDARWGGRRLGTSNVVIHEFAHALGQRSDPQESVPIPSDPAKAKQWRQRIEIEFQRLREDVDRGRDTLLDPSRAESLAEFFAVATETFFLQPVAFRHHHRKFYDTLADWFHQDPARRRAPTAREWTDMEEAEDEYEKHILAECNTAIRLRPDYLDAYLARAHAHRALGNLAEGVEYYGAVFRVDPGKAEILCERGAALAELGRLPEALADFDRAHGLAPDFARPLQERAALFLEQGDLARAVADATEAIRLEGDDADAYEIRAEAYKAMGDGKRARADRESARRLRE
jgi:Mlc titration factor MtfA (ptsG expression regulator)